MFEVEMLLDMVRSVGKYGTFNELLGDIFVFYPVDLEESIDSLEVDRIKRGFQEELSLEIGGDLSTWIANRLFGLIPQKRITTRMEILKAVLKQYRQIALQWLPILTSFSSSVVKQCMQSNIQMLYVLTRDGLPFYPVLRESKVTTGWKGEIKLLELSRKTLGLYDEISKERSQKRGRLILEYTREHFNSRLVACVDAGCYGTVVKELSSLVSTKHLPWIFFFNTANPYIWGFVNKVVEYGNLTKVIVPFDFIWILGDTIEAFPKPYKEVRLRKSGREVVLTASPVYWLCGISAFYFYWILNKYTPQAGKAADPWKSVLKLYRVYSRVVQDAKYAPCLLPGFINEWSEAESFLNNWRCGSIPPQVEFV